MRTSIIPVFIGLCAVGLTSGCATTRQHVALPDQEVALENQNKVRIYVLRPEMLLGGRARMKVRDGERVIGDLGTRSFLCWERDPGNVTVFLDFYTMDGYTIAMPEEIDLQRGQVYFLRAGLLSVNPVSKDTNKLDRLWLLDNGEGERLLRGCKPPPLAKQR